MMKRFDFHGHRKKEMVQDAFIALIPPLLMLVGMLIASFFFFQIVFKDLRSSTERPKSYIPLMLFDFTMGVICSVLLYLGRVGRKQVLGDG